ncbi:MarR family winged helix-turn-helix transcriptional regulator [Bacillus fonticola]|uniref:MarR family winged helix-turn-helix transcriptional regulator n=1 Tax=Bacillus fonticola TaxID=2728853 RepID=UPI001D146484|nr:MarR family transcriptional regulator [Bacillus fonticola]
MRKEMQRVFGEFASINEFAVLYILDTDGDKKASDLAKMLQVSASHITTVTDSLVQKGYITRRRSQNDRRVVHLSLTEEGTAFLKEVEAKKSAYLQSKFQAFEDAELDTMIHLFEKMSRSID